MRKFIFSSLVVLLTTLTLSAHNNGGLFSFGGRIGIVSSSEEVPNTSEGLSEVFNAEGTGWTGALVARVDVPILPLFIQPELQFTSTTLSIAQASDNSSATAKHTYLDLPVMLGAEIGLGDLVRVRANAGPVFSIVADKGLSELDSDDFIAAYETPSMTWAAGFGVSILSFTADLRYNGSFTNGVFDKENIIGSIDTKATSWTLSIGVMF